MYQVEIEDEIQSAEKEIDRKSIYAEEIYCFVVFGQCD